MRNLSATEAEDVQAFKLESLLSPKLELISVKTSRGTCDPTGCRLGTLPATGIRDDHGRDEGGLDGRRGEHHPRQHDLARDRAREQHRLGARPDHRPAGSAGGRVCRYVTVRPTALSAKRTSVFVAQARDRRGRPVRDLALVARGPGVNSRATTDPSGRARFVVSPAQPGLLYVNPPGRTTAAAGTRPCAVALGVLAAASPPPPLTG